MPKVTYTNAKGLYQETGLGRVAFNGQRHLWILIWKYYFIISDFLNSDFYNPMPRLPVFIFSLVAENNLIGEVEIDETL